MMPQSPHDALDFDVCDRGHAANGTRGPYFQRQVGAEHESESWQTIEAAVIRGGLDDRPGAGNGISVGAIAWRGSIWLYRFRLGLRDAHGRLGRLIFVIVRTDRSVGFDSERIARLLGAADALRGLPLDLAPLEHPAQPDAAILVAQRGIEALLERERETCKGLEDGRHAAWIVGADGGPSTNIELERIQATHAPRPEARVAPQRRPIDRASEGPSTLTAGPRGSREPAASGDERPVSIRTWPLVAASFAFLGAVIVATRIETVTLEDGSRVRVLRLSEVSPPEPKPVNSKARQTPAPTEEAASQSAEDAQRSGKNTPRPDPKEQR